MDRGKSNMRLLLYDFGSYIQEGIKKVFNNIGITHKNVYYKLGNAYEDSFFEKRVKAMLTETSYDAVMSVNYWPILSRICLDKQIPYIVWSYDSPISSVDITKTCGFKNAYLFLFDRAECNRYNQKGFTNVYHLPLAVDTDRLDEVKLNVRLMKKYKADITLVGEIYKSVLADFLNTIPEYDKGYLSAVLQSQLKIQGNGLISTLIDDELVARINKSYKNVLEEPLLTTGLRTTMEREITHIDRLLLLETLSEEFQVNLFSSWTEPELKAVNWMGTAEYFVEMPRIFKCSKINLNPTLRSIETGIPLRVLDIMGSGGFVLSNYQEEIAENFIDGEEVVMYDSMEDAVDKCRYYLQHDEERKRIAMNGYEKVKKEFNFEKQIAKILNTVFKNNSLGV